MTRVRISVGIILLLVGVSIFSGIWADRKKALLTAEAKQVSEAFESGRTEDARKYAHILCRDWEDTRKKASFFVKYDRLLELDRIAAHFESMAETGDDELLPQIAEFIHMIEL
ncbi:MAG: DUF4363 family protein [Ruminococcus sp.]|nr:DUF4363 family protein [Ruminococcus sp.]